MKKFIALLLTLVTVTSIITFPASASETTPEVEKTRLDEIMMDHYADLAQLQTQSEDAQSVDFRSASSAILDLQSKTVAALRAEGYEAYGVNAQTFKETEEILETDLSSAGCDENGTYIIVIEGLESETGDISPQATGNSFSYSYGGKNYTLRYMTIYPEEDPKFNKVDTVNVMDTKVQSVFENIINQTLYILADAATAGTKIPFGTIASIFNIKVANFSTSSSSKADYSGATAWTRRYTQVYDPIIHDFSNKLFVEEALSQAWLRCIYYDPSIREFVNEQSEKRKEIIHSDKFDDYKWRKDQAIVAYLGNYPCVKRSVSKVTYCIGSKTVITHREDF